MDEKWIKLVIYSGKHFHLGWFIGMKSLSLLAKKALLRFLFYGLLSDLAMDKHCQRPDFDQCLNSILFSVHFESFFHF